MEELVTLADLNVLPPRSYDVLIGMDWTGAHGAKLDCYHKTFERLDEEGNLKVVKGFPKLISLFRGSPGISSGKTFMNSRNT